MDVLYKYIIEQPHNLVCHDQMARLSSTMHIIEQPHNLVCHDQMARLSSTMHAGRTAVHMQLNSAEHSGLTCRIYVAISCMQSRLPCIFSFMFTPLCACTLFEEIANFNCY